MADTSKIDTQGMGAPLTPEELAKWKAKGGTQKKHLPAEVRPRRMLTHTEVKELKILINEVLDERDGKRGVSYFDSEKFKHRINEPEPPYERWE